MFSLEGVEVVKCDVRSFRVDGVFCCFKGKLGRSLLVRMGGWGFCCFIVVRLVFFFFFLGWKEDFSVKIVYLK